MDLDTRPPLQLGILSDTHIPYRLNHLPNQVLEALDGVDVILHAGDVDRPGALETLREIAPVHAVRGNVHFLDLSSGGVSLPRLIQLDLAGRRVCVTHGCWLSPASFWLKGEHLLRRLLGVRNQDRFNEHIAHRLLRLHPAADVIAFGHTHRAYVRWIGDTLLVNPGAVSPTLGERPSVARIRLDADKTEVTIVPLKLNEEESTAGSQDIKETAMRQGLKAGNSPD